jgi:DNA-binding GntR family transcriptional regulator
VGRIVDAITTAIVERVRLMPGTKLAEQQIADIFKVSRTLVRQALNQLSRDHLVTLEPARGAFVAQPSVDEARQVFEVRKMLEAGMVRQLCAVPSPTRRSPRAAGPPAARGRRRGPHRRGRPHRLLADFHVVLARAAGQRGAGPAAGRPAVALAADLADVPVVALGRTLVRAEHVAIVDALQRRDARAAARLMKSTWTTWNATCAFTRASTTCPRPWASTSCHDPCPALPPRPARLRPRRAARALARRRPRGRAVRAELRGRRREQPLLHGDPTTETFLSEMVTAQAYENRHMTMESMYEYGSRVGVWRMLREFDAAACR